MEAKKMNFFQKFIASFTNFEAYISFAKESGGKVFVYLLLLTFTVGTLGLIKPTIEFNKGVNEISHLFKTEVRDFTFSNGVLNVQGDMPIVFDEGASVVIVDTTGGTTVDALNQYDRGMLLTDTQMISKNGVSLSTTNFSDLSRFSLTKATIENMIPMMKFFSFFIAVFGWIGFFVGKLFSALIVAIVALILRASLKVNATFGTLFRLAIYSLTALTLVDLVVGFFGVTIPFYFWLFHLAALAILWLGLKEVKKEQDEGDTLPPSGTDNALPGDPGTGI